MDADRARWYFRHMTSTLADPPPSAVPAYALYGEELSFPDVLHCEMLADRAPLHDWTIRPHRHGRLHQLFLVSAGGARFHMDGSVFALTPPALINVPRGVVHGFHFEQGAQGFVLTIPAVELAEVFAPGGWLARTLERGFVAQAPASMLSLFAALLDEFRANNPARATMLRALATQIACAVARTGGAGEGASAAGAQPSSQPPNPQPPNPHMARFAEQARERVRDGWSVADHARALGLSRTHLNRLCRAATGTTAQRFIENMLFQEACRLIAYTMQDVASVGYQLGFDDPSYFSRAFRRNVGMTPTDYRARLER